MFKVECSAAVEHPLHRALPAQSSATLNTAAHGPTAWIDHGGGK